MTHSCAARFSSRSRSPAEYGSLRVSTAVYQYPESVPVISSTNQAAAISTIQRPYGPVMKSAVKKLDSWPMNHRRVKPVRPSRMIALVLTIINPRPIF